MTTTRIYRSTDSGAPTLTGEVGSYNALIKAVLVGVSGVAYGTGPNEKAAAGWTVNAEDVGTHKLVLKNSLAAGGTGMLARFHDNAQTSGAARDVTIACYSAMSDIDTGSDLIPPSAVQSSGGIIRKSATANSTARPWIIVADELTAYVQFQVDTTMWFFGGFGDYESYVPGDDYRYFVAAGVGLNQCQSNLVMTGVATLASPNVFGGRGNWLGRNLALSTAGEQFSVPALGVLNGGGAAAGSSISSSSAQMGGSCAPMADPAAGTGLRLYHPAMVGSEGVIRGRLRGLYVPLNNLLAQAFGAVDSTPANMPPGTALLIAKCSMANNTNPDFYAGTLAVDAVGPW